MSYDADLLNYIEAEVVTIKGAVQVKWTRLSVDSVILSVAIPNNMDANVFFDPLIKNGRCLKLKCDDKILCMREDENAELRLFENVRGVSDLTENQVTGVISTRVTSGEYTFIAYWQ
jgi:hypothetical protein